MKCNKCGENVIVQPGKSANFCSNCGNKIEVKKTKGWKWFDNTKELLEYIVLEYGNDALFGQRHFADHTDQLMPPGQKNLLKQVFDCGAVKILQDDMNSDQQRKETAVKRAVSKMVDTYSTAKDAAERVVWEFTNAIGWGMPEPAIGIVTPPVDPEPIYDPPAPTPTGNIAVLMTRAWQFAEDGDWQDAASYFNRVLDTVSTYAPAFLGLLCVDLKASKEDKLKNVKDPNSITNHKHYKRAITDPIIKARLEGYIQTIKTRIAAEQKAAAEEADRRRRAAEEAARRKRVQDAFDNACKIMNTAQSPDDYKKAIAAFVSIDSGYQDINNQIKGKIAECERRKTALETAPPIKSIYKFGSLNWIVLDVKDSKVLLLLEKIWDKRPYHSSNTAITWENCSLRKELNDEFYNKIPQAERSKIVNSPIINSKNRWFGTDGGRNTNDYVFLLSIEEVVRYFGDSGQLKNKNPKSKYWIDDQYNNARIAKGSSGSASWWWLRSPGDFPDRAAGVFGVGDVDMYGSGVSSSGGGVRPALWLNLQS